LSIVVIAIIIIIIFDVIDDEEKDIINDHINNIRIANRLLQATGVQEYIAGSSFELARASLCFLATTLNNNNNHDDHLRESKRPLPAS
jgi:hypothetical protein